MRPRARLTGLTNRSRMTNEMDFQLLEDILAPLNVDSSEANQIMKAPFDNLDSKGGNRVVIQGECLDNASN